VRFDVTTPCAACPFRRHGRLAVRLTANRIRDITGNLLDPDGGTFPCHKQMYGEKADDGGGYEASVDDVHCAGALIFVERHASEDRLPKVGARPVSKNRLLQIAERFGLYDPGQFCGADQRELVFATVAEMLATALPEGRK
jgi:hypothetical protein